MNIKLNEGTDPMDMIETKALEFAYPAEEGEKPVLALRGVDTAH